MANNTAGSNRQLWIDYARGIAIILVVYRHAFEGLKGTAAVAHYENNAGWAVHLEQANIFFFSFRMPLFFIVSGIFVAGSIAKRGLLPFIENKTRTILYPYFLWGCIQISVQLLFGAYTNGQSTTGSYLFLFYAPRELAQFWYLYALFNVMVLYTLVKVKIGFGALQQLVLGLAFFAFSIYCTRHKIELGFVSDVLHYYLYAAIGEAIAASVKDGALHRLLSSSRSLLLLLVPFAATQYYFLQTNWNHQSVSPKFLYVEHYQPVLYLLIALTGCVFIAVLSYQLAKRGQARWLLYTGRHSLYIYVMHVMAFAAVRIFCTHVLHWYHLPLLLAACIAGGVCLPMVAYKLFTKVGMRYLFTLEKEKPKPHPALVPTLKATA